MRPLHKFREKQALRAVAAITISGLALLAAACGATQPTPQSTSVNAAAAPVVTPTVRLLITPAPTVDKEEGTPPPPLPTPEPSTPIVVTINGAPGAELTPDQIVRNYGTVVIGSVIDKLPAQWTTPNGTRPANPWEQGTVPQQFTIVTPYVLKLEGTPLANLLGADVSNGHLVIVAEGGQVGEDVIENRAFREQFAIGERVLLAITDKYFHNEDVTQVFETPGGRAWAVGAKYVLTDDGFAVSQTSTQPAAELIAAIEAAAAVSPTPTVDLTRRAGKIII